MATNWRDLNVYDEDMRPIGTLGYSLDNASDSQIEHIRLNEDGVPNVESWADRYIAADGEDPEYDTPRGQVDWTGFAAELEDAISRL